MAHDLDVTAGLSCDNSDPRPLLRRRAMPDACKEASGTSQLRRGGHESHRGFATGVPDDARVWPDPIPERRPTRRRAWRQCPHFTRSKVYGLATTVRVTLAMTVTAVPDSGQGFFPRALPR